MKKEDFKEISRITATLFIGYLILALIGFASHSYNSVSGFATSSQTITEQDASLALGKSRDAVADMEKLGFNTIRVKDLLEDARREMSLKNYERVVAISDEISNLKQKASEIQDKIRNLSLRINNIKKYSLNTTGAEVLYNLSIIEFALENYESSEELIQKSVDELNAFTEQELEIVIDDLSNLKKFSLENGMNITRIENTINDAQNNLKSPEFKKINSLKQEFANLNKSVKALIDANNEIKVMAEAGLGTSRTNNILDEAKFALELGYYDKIGDILIGIKTLKSKAFELNSSIKKTKDKIEEVKSYGLDANESESLFNAAENELKLENYEDTEKLLKQSLEKSEKILSDYLLFGAISKKDLLKNTINFLKKFWLVVLITVITGSIFSRIMFQKTSIALLENSLKNIEKEKSALINLIKKTQTEYFKDKTLDKSTYNLRIDKYQDRMMQIKEKMPIISAKLAQKKEIKWRFSKLKNKFFQKTRSQK